MPKGLLGWYTCSFSCFLSVKEGVWMTDSTPPSILFFRASGVKTEELFGALYPFTFVIVLVGFPFCWTTRWQDTLQIMLQLSEPGTVWCQNLSFTSDPHGVNAALYVRCFGAQVKWRRPWTHLRLLRIAVRMRSRRILQRLATGRLLWRALSHKEPAFRKLFLKPTPSLKWRWIVFGEKAWPLAIPFFRTALEGGSDRGLKCTNSVNSIPPSPDVDSNV